MSKQTINYALHNPGAWPGSRTDDADEVIRLRGELAAALAKLDAANERARGMAGDLATMMHENAAQAVIIGKLNHTNDELRYQMRLAARADMGQAMTALMSAALTADITDIARAYGANEIDLTTAVQMATDAGEKLTLKDTAAGTLTYDLSSIPAGATIHSATLTLTDRGDGADGYGVMPNE